MAGTASVGLALLPVAGLPLIKSGDDLGVLIVECASASGVPIDDGDICVVAQKIVSKAEGRMVDLKTVRPSARAVSLSETVNKDPRLVEIILSESVRVVRAVPDILIVEHRLGFIHANAGVDRSNVAEGQDHDWVLLLPHDPDASARRLRATIAKRTSKTVGVLIIDTMGRAWRRGVVGQAIGCAGVKAVEDLRGTPDLFGRVLESTDVAAADELAAAASLVMGQADEGTPVVIVRGVSRLVGGGDTGRTLLREPERDLFRQ